MLRSALNVFPMVGLPSALLGAFPLWLGWRRGRRLVGLAALVFGVAAGWAAIVLVDRGQPTDDLFTLAVVGAAGGLVSAVAWSLLLLRIPAR